MSLLDTFKWRKDYPYIDAILKSRITIYDQIDRITKYYYDKDKTIINIDIIDYLNFNGLKIDSIFNTTKDFIQLEANLNFKLIEELINITDEQTIKKVFGEIRFNDIKEALYKFNLLNEIYDLESDKEKINLLIKDYNLHSIKYLNERNKNYLA